MGALHVGSIADAARAALHRAYAADLFAENPGQSFLEPFRVETSKTQAMGELAEAP
jgi:hypothetical protein